jgi:uncharacterized protein (TIGR02246 family)
MMLAAPEDFPRAFANAFAARDAARLAGLFDADGDLLSPTGLWAEGREAIAEVFAAEWAGALARTKLVSGRLKLRPLGAGAAQIMQRLILSGITQADGRDSGRLAAVMTATLLQGPQGWQAVSAQFAAEG